MTITLTEETIAGIIFGAACIAAFVSSPPFRTITLAMVAGTGLATYVDGGFDAFVSVLSRTIGALATYPNFRSGIAVGFTVALVLIAVNAIDRGKRTRKAAYIEVEPSMDD